MRYRYWSEREALSGVLRIASTIDAGFPQTLTQQEGPEVNDYYDYYYYYSHHHHHYS